MTEVKSKLSSRPIRKPLSKTAFFNTNASKVQRHSGPLHRNPYLNFLREFRIRNSGLAAVEIIRRGAKEWTNMPKEEKLQYIQEAQMCMAPTHPEDCGIVCPKVNACGKKRRKRKSKCTRKRRPKKRRCAKKRRPNRRSTGCRKKKRRCRV